MTDPVNHIDRRVGGLEQSHTFLKEALGGMSGKLDLILVQITKVAVLEEKSSVQQIDINRAHNKISTVEIKHDLMIKALEDKHDDFAKIVLDFIAFTKGLTKLAYILWSSLGSVVFLILIKILFFAGNAGFTP
ncbi:hypothetical protein [Propionivibrio sp.]|uniref:hypothetical protein n=1 Tax=Propionivibrio sp. TaxID=2212460 RepID=UPI003BF25F03